MLSAMVPVIVLSLYKDPDRRCTRHTEHYANGRCLASP
jgi:hypothetical protein